MAADTRRDQGAGNWIVEWVNETDSTQIDLLQRCSDGSLVDRTARAARFQRSGRGRLDRRWDAPPGTNLLVSLGFVQAGLDPGVAMRTAALAVTSTAHHYGLVDAGIKWPNDVLVDGRKLAGLLAQRFDDTIVVVGIGLNVNWAPDGAARLAGDDAADDVLSLEAVLATLLDAFDAVGFDAEEVAAAYRRRLTTLGQTVRVDLGDSTLVGTAIDITPDGRLVVDVDGARHTISAGDVFHLRSV